MCMCLLQFVQTTPWSFLLALLFRGWDYPFGLFLLPLCWYVFGLELSKILSYSSILFRLTQIISMRKFSILMRYIHTYYNVTDILLLYWSVCSAFPLFDWFVYGNDGKETLHRGGNCAWSDLMQICWYVISLLQGLCHISELSNRKLAKVEDVSSWCFSFFYGTWSIWLWNL
jgi:hypothetical protein